MRVLMLLPLLGALATAQATSLNTAQVAISPNFSGGTGPFSAIDNQYGVASASGSATGGFDSSGSASSWADWGVVKLSGDSVGSLNTVVYGTFRDGLTITAPGVAAGTVGSVTFWVLVDGSLQVNDLGIATAGWSLSADLGGGAYDISRHGALYNDSLIFTQHGYVGDPFGAYSATVSFQFGFAAPLTVDVAGSAQTGYDFDPGVAHASFDLAHSVYWGGISSVTINGTPVSGFSVASESGTNYLGSMAPVPEPDASLLLLAGLPLLAWQLRRRRSAR